MTASATQASSASQAPYQCGLCNKNFERRDLRDRHKRRCARSLAMPRKSKRKACQACAASKLGCDLALPSCSRCANRDIPCNYVNPNHQPTSEEPLGPDEDGLLLQTTNHNDSLPVDSQRRFSLETGDFRELFSGVTPSIRYATSNTNVSPSMTVTSPNVDDGFNAANLQHNHLSRRSTSQHAGMQLQGHDSTQPIAWTQEYGMTQALNVENASQSAHTWGSRHSSIANSESSFAPYPSRREWSNNPGHETLGDMGDVHSLQQPADHEQDDISMNTPHDEFNFDLLGSFGVPTGRNNISSAIMDRPLGIGVSQGANMANFTPLPWKPPIPWVPKVTPSLNSSRSESHNAGMLPTNSSESFRSSKNTQPSFETDTPRPSRRQQPQHPQHAQQPRQTRKQQQQQQPVVRKRHQRPSKTPFSPPVQCPFHKMGSDDDLVRIVYGYPQTMLKFGQYPPFVHHKVYKCAEGDVLEPLANAFCCVSAFNASLPSSERFAYSMMNDERDRLVKGFRNCDALDIETLAVVHAMCVYQIVGFFGASAEQARSAELQHPFFLKMARKLAQSHLRPSSPRPSKKDYNSSAINPSAGSKATHSATSTTSNNESNWRKWILTETIRRTLFLVNIINTLSCRMTKQNPYFYETLDDDLILDMPLPAPESLWKANSAEEWVLAKRMLAAGKELSVSSRDLMNWFQNEQDSGDEDDDYGSDESGNENGDSDDDDGPEGGNINRDGSNRYRNGAGVGHAHLKRADRAAGIDINELPQFTRLILTTLKVQNED